MEASDRRKRKMESVANGIMFSLILLFVGTWITFGAGWAFMFVGTAMLGFTILAAVGQDR